MKFTPVEKLPERAPTNFDGKCSYKPVQDRIKEFMKMGVKYARVDIRIDDYATITDAYHSLIGSVYRSKAPIKVVRRNHEIYFVRRDMED